jgi:ketosteroid isomerase-like protein
MLAVEPKDPEGESPSSDRLQPNSSADEFFSKMNRDFRRPKPSEEAVAAALQAIQALAGDAGLEEDAESVSEAAVPEPVEGNQCPKCGKVNSGPNRFCGFCGAIINKPAAKPAGTGQESSGQHVHHHHYHHHYFPGQSGAKVESGEGVLPVVSGESLSEQEGADAQSTDSLLRKVIENWCLACNGRRVEALSNLYSSDALLVRGGSPLARGRAAIKQTLQTELESGLGDVQLDCSEVGVIGDVACVAGTSRMLAPIAPANRQERTGKFLYVMRREGADWKILADVWCMDAAAGARPVPKSKK